VAAQGGDARMVDEPERLPRAARVEMLRADRAGYVAGIAADRIGLASMRLGAGRAKKGDPIDHGTGIVLRAKVGDVVERGEPYAEVHASGRPGDAEAADIVRSAFAWHDAPVGQRKLVLTRIR
ncbi:MAG: pyrimidine-nucleoside phosphorylase, partial [Chloroflexota bacterium]